MSDFAIFDELEVKSTKVYEGNCSCTEPDIVCENGINVCTECGEEINHPILHDKEWRYYGSSDSKRSSDPNRVHARKIDDKNISKDVQNMAFSDSIVSKANDLYLQCTNGQIYRGGSRKGVIFACVFYAYKLAGNHQTPDSLIQSFGLTRKAGLKGLKIVNVNAPRDSEIHDTSITAKHVICDMMDKFLTSDDQKNNVYSIYESIKNRSSKLNRARPQSVAAAVIYHWITQNNISISIDEFARSIGLSELTIQKNMKELRDVLDRL